MSDSYYMLPDRFDPLLSEEDREIVSWLRACTYGIDSLRFRPISPELGFSISNSIVDVVSDFNCADRDLADFSGVRFGMVTGSFRCSYNKLTSLEGAPVSVVKDFHCGNNHLTSLKGAPSEVGGNLYLGDNQLTSLEGAPFVSDLAYNSTPQQISSFFAGVFINNPVSEETLESIYKHMYLGHSYANALFMQWHKMPIEDRMLMYKDNLLLDPDERMGYELMDRVKGISI